MCSSPHTCYITSNCSTCPCQETVGSRRARARCSSDPGLQPEWMDGCPVAELSFGELWVPSQGHIHPFQSFLCISLVLFPNTSSSHHFPLSVPSDLHPHFPLQHTKLPYAKPTSFRVPRATGKFPWSFPEMGPLPPPHQKVPSPRPSSYSCLTITLIFFIAYMKKMLIYSCLPHKNGAQGLGLRPSFSSASPAPARKLNSSLGNDALLPLL